MSTVIEMGLDGDSIERAVKRIENYRKQMDAKMETLCERLALIGAKVMRATYTSALYAGTNDIEVSVDLNGKTATIHADGSTVAFIEFGTGINYPMGEFGERMGIPPHGTYGKLKGATGKTWAYIGEQGTTGIPAGKGKLGLYRTDGNSPANALPAAEKAMRDEVQRIAREVFDQ